MANYTKLTNLEVTGDLKGNTVTLDLSSITRPTDCGDSYAKADVNKIVAAVNGILTALGKPTS